MTDAAIDGEDGPRSDIMVMPWLSEHRAVVDRGKVLTPSSGAPRGC